MAEKNINKIIIGEDTYNLRDSSVPSWAKEENKPTYTADEVGAYTKTEVDNKIANLGGANIVYIPNESLMPDIIDDNTLYVIGEEDLLSFRIIIVNVNNIVDENIFYYRDGMTWGTWIGSDLCPNKNDFSTGLEVSGVMVAAADPEEYLYYEDRPLLSHDRSRHISYMEFIEPNNQISNCYVAWSNGGSD